MVIDWFGFGYAATIALGGYMGYKRKGSMVSLIAGLLFGILSAYGAVLITIDPSDRKISLLASGTLTVVMGIRFKRSGKIIPAGVMAGLSLLRILQLLFTL